MEIKFTDVSYEYNEGLDNRKEALKGISTILEKGKIHGIIGKPGSGKSTLVQLINNLLTPTKGVINVEDFILRKQYNNRDISLLRKKVGFVFQFPEEQFFETTVEKEIGFALNNFKFDKSKINKKVIDILKVIGLDETYLNKNPFNLSFGEKRKIAIASILVYNPSVLILDEPTVGLDSRNKKDLILLIKKLNERYKKTIIIVSHDIDMIYNISNNILIMDNGKLVCNLPKEEISKNYSIFKKHDICPPKILEFSRMVLEEKKIKLGEYDDIKDLIKAVYRNV